MLIFGYLDERLLRKSVRDPLSGARKLLVQALEAGLECSVLREDLGARNMGLFIVDVPRLYVKFESGCSQLPALYAELSELEKRDTTGAFPRVPRLLLHRSETTTRGQGVTASVVEGVPGVTYNTFIINGTDLSLLKTVTTAVVRSASAFNCQGVRDTKMVRCHGDFHASNILVDVDPEGQELPRVSLISPLPSSC